MRYDTVILHWGVGSTRCLETVAAGHVPRLRKPQSVKRQTDTYARSGRSEETYALQQVRRPDLFPHRNTSDQTLSLIHI